MRWAGVQMTIFQKCGLYLFYIYTEVFPGEPHIKRDAEKNVDLMVVFFCLFGENPLKNLKKPGNLHLNNFGFYIDKNTIF